ncbi:hypothetical protein [Flavobacterium album]|uniref:hypothetical protein n=1 Tax=Flavobacterium album TaxID=2175091 RepID=UPI0015E7FF67|nr:hypothetical protein [Flavobacterium album]
MLLKPDEKFNGKELTKTVKISDGKASFSLTLDDSWEKNIKKDVGFEIEFYWVA